jgi:hypothetical protein
MPAAMRKDDCTPEEAVALIRNMPANPAQIRPATQNLVEVLQSATSDPSFDLESWQRQWSAVEAELKSMTHANEVAEGRRQ